VGPYRATATKGDAGRELGPDGLRRFIELAHGKPCIAIGGVQPGDVAIILRRGATGVAVVSGLLGQTDVETAAGAYSLSALRQ
jgi:thiamine monophosphate synthase